MNRRLPRLRVLLPIGLVVVALLCGARPLAVRISLSRASAALERHDADAAVNWIERALWWDGKAAEAYFLHARAARRRGELDRMRESLVNAARFGWPRKSIRREEWLAMAQAGHMSEAEPHLAELLRKPGGDGAEICEAYVNGYFMNYRFQPALALLEGWEADYPDDPDPHVFRGLFYEHVHNHEAAADEYRRASELAPGRNDIALRLGWVLVTQHQYDQAANHFQRCLDRNADSLDAAVGWARCLAASGEADTAEHVLQKIVAENPEHYEARLELGKSLNLSGQPRAALDLLRRVCQERPNDTEARYALASSLAALGKTDAAQEHFAFVEQAQAAMQEVQNLAERVLAEPDDVEPRYKVGIRLLEFDNPEHGAAWLRTVLEIQPDHRPAREALAEYHTRNGNLELAERYSRGIGDE